SLPEPADQQAIQTASFETAADPEMEPSPPAFVEAQLDAPFTPRNPAVEQTTVDAIASPQFREELRALGIDLTLAVAKDLSQWRLGPLQERAERLERGTANPNDRQQAAELLQTISQFERLCQRYRRLAGGMSP
ncbi:MAG: hypothetical protein KY475_26800, partial [Planctomycetes bacterium]|nr:hypothetical protein [Planctomycetota bacterium]